MAKDGKHVIHAGGVFPNPLLNREGRATAVKPGTWLLRCWRLQGVG